MTSGYSQTPLAKKLGLKEGFIIKLINIPAYYYDLFSDLPEKLTLQSDVSTKKDLIHFFTRKVDELEENIEVLTKEIKQNGMIWVSWPKGSSKVKTDITENVIRKIALKNGLVDVKVCSVDETWSGLKLVIPLKHRK